MALFKTQKSVSRTIKTDWSLMKPIRSSADFLIFQLPETRASRFRAEDYSHNPLLDARKKKFLAEKMDFISRQRSRGKMLCKAVCELYNLISFRAWDFCHLSFNYIEWLCSVHAFETFLGLDRGRQVGERQADWLAGDEKWRWDKEADETHQ